MRDDDLPGPDAQQAARSKMSTTWFLTAITAPHLAFFIGFVWVPNTWVTTEPPH